MNEPASCSHCGLPVPRGLLDAGAELQFCCSGCRTVFAVIHDRGLNRYYDYRSAAGEAGRQASPTGRDFDELDEPAFYDLYCKRDAEGQTHVELYLEGVHCSACVWLVEKVSLTLPGAREATLDIGRSTVRLVFNPEETKLSELARALDGVGYRPHPQRGYRAAELRRKEDRGLLARIAVAGAAAGNVMLMSAALYSGAFSGMESDYRALFRWGSLLVSVPAVIWSAGVFFRGAWGAVKARSAHMDIPISLGILVGFVWGGYATIRSSGEIYFDSITALIFLLLVGRWLQRRQQQAAYAAAELLHSLAPSTARRLGQFEGEGVEARQVPVESLVPGDRLEVRAGDTIPVDGRVGSGSSAIDTSLLTGESRPERVAEGCCVHAGCVNLEARLVIVAEKTGEETRLAQLMKEVEAAARRRPPVVLLADRISGWFVAAVLSLATLTLLGWLWLDPEHAVEHAVALLVVSCPCALGMATPLAVSAALGRAARSGLLIKGGHVIEHLARPGVMVFDKTGTLTMGRLELVAFVGDETLKPMIRAVEAQSSHPMATAFLRAIEPGEAQGTRLKAAPEPLVEALEQRLGAGIRATVDGRRMRIGAQPFVLEEATAEPWVAEAVVAATSAAHSPVLVAVDGEVRAVASFGDPVRPDAADCLRRLQSLGYELRILSGDHHAVVTALSRTMHVQFADVRGGVSPEEKLHRIESMVAARSKSATPPSFLSPSGTPLGANRWQLFGRNRSPSLSIGPVVMVGDGVNDAAALAAASVGVAVHGGAEASLAAADVFATRDGIEPVVALVEGSRRTMRAIRRNLIFSLAYNVLGVTLAVMGLIDPLLAAVLMPLSSLTVVTSSFRARTFLRPS